MRCVTVFVLFVTVAINAQVKDDISVVQFSAEFVKSSEISLNVFKDYNIQTLYLSKNQKIFQKEKITSLPTIILYNDGEEVLKIDGGISMKLPEDSIEQINEHINKILETRF
jgi:thiol-disulfide isomerase/thioredoxin|tara:strand:- start:866 stop:1201 length:336 start_codon:yes stop_codon:yes gene_type:complete